MARTLTVPKNRAPIHPGEIIEEEFRKPLGLTQEKFAEALGIDRVRYSAIAHGRRGITPNTALRLAKVLGTSVEMWLRLQMMVDLYRELHGPDAAKIESLPPVKAELVRS